MTEAETTSRSNISQNAKASRRDFFALLWKSALGIAGMLGLTAVTKFLSHTPDSSTQTRFDLGPVDQLSTSAMTMFPAAQAFIIPIPGGFEALSLVCPHLGCQVETWDDGFECPCHGSRFAPDGLLIKGPAKTSLRTLRTEISAEGHLILDLSDK